LVFFNFEIIFKNDCCVHNWHCWLRVGKCTCGKEGRGEDDHAEESFHLRCSGFSIVELENTLRWRAGTAPEWRVHFGFSKAKKTPTNWPGFKVSGAETCRGPVGWGEKIGTEEAE
jgi:hypothetical protein